ncbi:hypothetical protein Belba_3006 [Belliella baltica DSM 15883]|uniref:Uncharacterized protein n=1 Tax=Belliella baltica (strain DSM 15883 / CIP 108006 / LMG 21964 / BA134) TaxID=866536 RepID=I3Z8F7_BELBD|nr:hypothetical protein Belba_3006 [Belliella baltica DSM 15883]
MENQDFQIVPYTDNLRNQLINVWERSVLAKHSFLKPNDSENEIRSIASSNLKQPRKA